MGQPTEPVTARVAPPAPGGHPREATGAAPPDQDVGALDVAWAHGPLGDLLREAAGRLVLEPLLRFYTRRHVRGLAHLAGITGPVVFVANHGSHMDTPTILHALPRRWRRRTVVAAAADYFYRDRALALVVSVLFNTVPIARRGASASTAHIDRLFDRGYSLLLYPEGTRNRTGRIGRLRQGAALLAARHAAQIVPIHITGTREAMPPGQRWPRRIGRGPASRRHPVTITFGPPIPAPTGDRRAATERISRFFSEHAPGARR